MPGLKPDKLHDDLDALLDGHSVELTDDLVPLAEAADALWVELASYELDPEVADRHLAQVLDGSATVAVLPARGHVNGWRRRMAGVMLAATLVLAPATMASAAALPGQAMYPLKLAIEQLHLASVQWSPAREAGQRIQIADERLDELDQLVNLGMDAHVPDAVRAVDRAVIAATWAVQEASIQGVDVTKAAGELGAVKQQQQAQLTTLLQRLPTAPSSIRTAIATAVEQSKAPSQQVTPSLNTTVPPAATAAPPLPASSPSTTTSAAVTTTELTTITTESPTTTTEPPTTTTTVATENTTASLEEQGQNQEAPASSAGP